MPKKQFIFQWDRNNKKISAATWLQRENRKQEFTVLCFKIENEGTFELLWKCERRIFLRSQSHGFYSHFRPKFCHMCFFRLCAIALPRDRSALVPCLLSHLTFGNRKVICNTYNPAIDIIVLYTQMKTYRNETKERTTIQTILPFSYANDVCHLYLCNITALCVHSPHNVAFSNSVTVLKWKKNCRSFSQFKRQKKNKKVDKCDFKGASCSFDANELNGNVKDWKYSFYQTFA